MNPIRQLGAGVLDIVYPPHCVVCNRADPNWLCSSCKQSITYLEPPYCIKCGIPCSQGICQRCKNAVFAFWSANSAVEFSEPIVEVVHKFKYGGCIALADALAQIMIDRFDRTGLSGKFELIVAVPEHRSRAAERGFNQAEKLACRLSKGVGVEYVPNVLHKIRKTDPQVGLQAQQRISNLEGAYTVSRDIALTGRKVLVIDDVMTTGSTLNEAARALTQAGASKVMAYTLARSM